VPTLGGVVANAPARTTSDVVSPKRPARPGPSVAHGENPSLRRARPGSGVRISLPPWSNHITPRRQIGSGVFDSVADRSLARTSLERIAPESLTRTRRCSFTARCRAADYCLPPDAVSKRSPRAGGRSTIGDLPESTNFSQSQGTNPEFSLASAVRDCAADDGRTLTGQAWLGLSAAAGLR
jgi:hypothetical protein